MAYQLKPLLLLSRGSLAEDQAPFADSPRNPAHFRFSTINTAPGLWTPQPAHFLEAYFSVLATRSYILVTHSTHSCNIRRASCRPCLILKSRRGWTKN